MVWLPLLPQRISIQPNSKSLSYVSTRQAVEDIFSSLAADSEMLAPMGSSQANESFNNVVCSKAPKMRHNGGKVSKDLRVAAAVLQKNDGLSYVSSVVSKAGLSPSHFVESQSRKRASKAVARAGFYSLNRTTKTGKRWLLPKAVSIFTTICCCQESHILKGYESLLKFEPKEIPVSVCTWCPTW